MNKIEQAIKLTKNFKQQHPWKNKSILLWQRYLDKLCEIYNKQRLQLIVDSKNTYLHLSCGELDFVNKTIRMRKFSMITLLHEFGHYLYGYSEDKARKFSWKIFFAVFPKKREKLIRRGEVYVKKGD